MKYAVEINELSKMYRLGESGHHRMLRDALSSLFRGKTEKKAEDDILWALRDVSFNVEPGEVVGLIGRNGAGKSTLLKVVSKITYPTSGTVKTRGRFASLLEVGTGFHQELSGRENIFLNGSILGMTKKEVERKMDQIVAFSGVERFLDTPIKRYSSGMRLRLGFAVAAHLDPDVMLVDEVLAVGDVAFQRKCLTAMDEMRTSGRTVLFVSHNMEAVENLCSRCIWIDAGSVRQDGPAREVIAEYMKTYEHVQGQAADLTDFEPRRGNGKGRITGFEVLDVHGAPITYARSGEPLRIRLHFEAKQHLIEPHFGVQISTNLGTLVCDMSSWNTGLEIPELLPGKGAIDMEIDALHLMGGDYRLGFWFESVGDEYDSLEHCGSLSVQPGDPFGTGRGLTNKFGIAYFPCRFKIQPASALQSETAAPSATTEGH